MAEEITYSLAELKAAGIVVGSAQLRESATSKVKYLSVLALGMRGAIFPTPPDRLTERGPTANLVWNGQPVPAEVRAGREQNPGVDGGGLWKKTDETGATYHIRGQGESVLFMYPKGKGMEGHYILAVAQNPNYQERPTGGDELFDGPTVTPAPAPVQAAAPAAKPTAPARTPARAPVRQVRTTPEPQAAAPREADMPEEDPFGDS